MARRRPDAVRPLVEPVAFGPLQQGLQGVGAVVDAPVQIAELGEAGGHGGDGERARVDVVDLVPGDGGGHGRLRHAAHRVGAGDRVVAGVLVVVDEERRGVAVLAPPGGRHLIGGAAFDLPGEGVRGPADVGEAPPWLDPDVDVQAVAARGLPGSRARCERPGARWRTRSAASGRGRCATRRAARCRPGGNSTGGTPPSTSAPPTPRWPARSRTARRRAGRSAGSPPAPSPATAARRPESASGAPSPRRPRRGTGASCTAAPAAPARCRRRPLCSSGPGRAWSRRGPGSTPGPGWRSAPSGARPRAPAHPWPPGKTNPSTGPGLARPASRAGLTGDPVAHPRRRGNDLR